MHSRVLRGAPQHSRGHSSATAATAAAARALIYVLHHISTESPCSSNSSSSCSATDTRVIWPHALTSVTAATAVTACIGHIRDAVSVFEHVICWHYEPLPQQTLRCCFSHRLTAELTLADTSTLASLQPGALLCERTLTAQMPYSTSSASNSMDFVCTN
jgi:hypothetical protein